MCKLERELRWASRTIQKLLLSERDVIKVVFCNQNLGIYLYMIFFFTIQLEKEVKRLGRPRTRIVPINRHQILQLAAQIQQQQQQQDPPPNPQNNPNNSGGRNGGNPPGGAAGAIAL